MALFSAGQLDEAERELRVAERWIATGSDGGVALQESATAETQTHEGQLIATQAIVACYRGDVTGAVLSGDIMHHPVQVAEPDWAAEYLDVDPAMVRETRRSFLQKYADSEVVAIGSHFAHPSGGHIRMERDSLRFFPAG